MPETIKTRAKWVWHSKRKKVFITHKNGYLRPHAARKSPTLRSCKMKFKSFAKRSIDFLILLCFFCFRDILTAEKILFTNVASSKSEPALLKNKVVRMVQKLAEISNT